MPDALEVAAEPTRRRLLHLLVAGEQTVTELTEHFSVTRSAISQHLLLLESVRLVAARKDGRSRYYRLDPSGMATLRALVGQFWNDELDLLARDAQRLADSKDPQPKDTP
ncbi:MULTISPECIES: metalloregulator ArsR/SmtB family transcription factor [Arthrobacter]|uniref:Metalloregulator ArsR/SmtB family transcription factor n=2 Tax=Arthrobacter TaxID=1663 RepID=A0ABU9KHY7_9MICC|nr:metalloregulator ArsR/SmtB family transcription factor [Arthrobacter sp. YJM1]MDP5226546.1 metalloregulator ArsR/SmtB family transcription factor [Arthrobacter sp. YJM1]